MDFKKEISEIINQVSHCTITTDEAIGEIEKLYNKHQALQLLQTDVMCSLCDGNGYTIEVQAECCRNYDENGNCCNVPSPVQVQKQCYCNGGLLPI